KSEYNIEGHDVFDKTKRPDKIVKEEDGSTRVEKVNRYGLPFQKRIVSIATAFAFGNDVKIKCTPSNEAENRVLKMLKLILHKNKMLSFNKKIGKELFRSTEVAEQWFPVSINDNSRPYGEQTSHKIKVEMFSPWKGNSLYPYFDSSGDMLAFSRKYMTKVDID